MFLLSMLATVPLALESTTHRSPESVWAVEADLLVPWVPEVHTFTVRGSRTLWGDPAASHADLVVGLYVRPNVTHSIVEKIDEYLVTVGYRQFIGSGLHVEAQLDVGYAWGTRNRIDGRDYNNPAVLAEAHAGYRLPLRLAGLFINPQVGVIHGLFTNIGPRGGRSDTFLSAKINLGWRFRPAGDSEQASP